MRGPGPKAALAAPSKPARNGQSVLMGANANIPQAPRALPRRLHQPCSRVYPETALPRVAFPRYAEVTEMGKSVPLLVKRGWHGRNLG